MDQPVTDVVFVSSPENCPKGYTMIKNCPCGHDANLWVKFLGGKSEERYICYTKEEREDGLIVEDMYIPGRGERYIVKGFNVIKKTVEGHDTLNHRFIAYKKVRRSKAKNAVFDVSVFRSKDQHSSAFKKLGAKLNNLYICIRQGSYSKSNDTPAPPPAAANTAAVSKAPSIDYKHEPQAPPIPPRAPPSSNTKQGSHDNIPFQAPPSLNEQTNVPYTETPPTSYNDPAPPTSYNSPPPTSYNNPAPPTSYNDPAPPTSYNQPPTSYNNPAPPTSYNSPPTSYNNPAPPTSYNSPPTSYNNPAPPTSYSAGYSASPPVDSQSSRSGSGSGSRSGSGSGGLLLGFEHLDLDQPIPEDWTWEDEDEEDFGLVPVQEMATLEITPTLGAAPPPPTNNTGPMAPPTTYSSYQAVPPTQYNTPPTQYNAPPTQYNSASYYYGNQPNQYNATPTSYYQPPSVGASYGGAQQQPNYTYPPYSGQPGSYQQQAPPTGQYGGYQQAPPTGQYGGYQQQAPPTGQYGYPPPQGQYGGQMAYPPTAQYGGYPAPPTQQQGGGQYNQPSIGFKF